MADGRNDVNLPFTRVLADRLAAGGNEIIDLKTIIAFMANYRIRTVGHLDRLNISRVRRDLGAAFVLLGTVTQQKDSPEASIGLTLNLVRTSDVRTIWSYIGNLSTGKERKVLGIGEPQSIAAMQPLLLDEIINQWPWQIINQAQKTGSINIDSVALQPKYVRPGVEVHSWVRLRDSWPADHAPRVFFKADDQLYPATVSADGRTYEGTWVAGEENGSFPVTLLCEWPYRRTESTLLGNYFVDGNPPVLEMTLRGTKILDGMPVFHQKLVIVPRLLVREPLSRWRLAFYYESGNLAGDMDGNGDLPEGFVWSGRGKAGSMVEDGVFDVVVEVWDKAGNLAKASKRVELNRSVPEVNLAVEEKADQGMVVDLAHDGKVPLASWRMEMWTKEGKLLTDREGKELPVKIKLSDSELDPKKIQGVVELEDVLGNRVRRKVEDLLPKIEKEAKAKAKKKKTTVSEKWVDEF
ncbi:MAG: hypothetical protein P8Y63_12030 [Deltaproteobacteria bacterium]